MGALFGVPIIHQELRNVGVDVKPPGVVVGAVNDDEFVIHIEGTPNLVTDKLGVVITVHVEHPLRQLGPGTAKSLDCFAHLLVALLGVQKGKANKYVPT